LEGVEKTDVKALLNLNDGSNKVKFDLLETLSIDRLKISFNQGDR
jgi:hypothetical protein